MELLRAEEVAYRDLFHNVDFALVEGGKLGLIGKSGSGKSVLLKLLAGELAPSEGRIVRVPGVRLRRVGLEPATQGRLHNAVERVLYHVRELEHALRAEERRLSAGTGDLSRYGELLAAFEERGGYGAEHRLWHWLEAAGLAGLELDRDLASLSGGERVRFALALAFAENPDVLLLDEPSRHLDLGGRRWLYTSLARFKGTVLVASHDRALLDEVTEATLVLEGTLERFAGSYSRYRAQHGVTLRSLAKQAHERTKEERRLQATVSALQRMGGRARQRKGLQRRLERLTPSPAAPIKSVAPLMLGAEHLRGTLLEAEHLSARVDGRTLFADVALHVAAKERVALVGPSGSGKSTLLALLAGALEPDDPRARVRLHTGAKLHYTSQHEHGLQVDVNLGEQLTHLVSEARARALLSLVGLRHWHYASVPASLSAGERARAGLALLTASEANLLLIDELDAALDLTATEQLEAALVTSEAACIVVSHDLALLRRLATQVWALEGGTLKVYRGGIDGYLRGEVRLLALNELEPAASQSVPAFDLEAQLEQLEDERHAIEERLLDPFALSERERERLAARQCQLLDELSCFYDARLGPPPPLAAPAMCGIALRADALPTAGRYRLAATSGLSATLIVGDGSIGHLALLEPEDRCLLPWAREVTLELFARVAFEHLGVQVLQLHASHTAAPPFFSAAGGGWWSSTRLAYERSLGLVRPRRRKARSRRDGKRYTA